MMEEPLVLCLLGAAIGCILLGIRLTHQRWKQRSPEARVICSSCSGWLSGLERVCPSCGKRLSYAVPSLPDAAAVLHAQQRTHEKVVAP